MRRSLSAFAILVLSLFAIAAHARDLEFSSIGYAFSCKMSAKNGDWITVEGCITEGKGDLSKACKARNVNLTIKRETNYDIMNQEGYKMVLHQSGDSYYVSPGWFTYEANFDDRIKFKIKSNENSPVGSLELAFIADEDEAPTYDKFNLNLKMGDGKTIVESAKGMSCEFSDYQHPY